MPVQTLLADVLERINAQTQLGHRSAVRRTRNVIGDVVEESRLLAAGVRPRQAAHYSVLVRVVDGTAQWSGHWRKRQWTSQRSGAVAICGSSMWSGPRTQSGPRSGQAIGARRQWTFARRIKPSVVAAASERALSVCRVALPKRFGEDVYHLREASGIQETAFSSLLRAIRRFL